MMGGRSLKGLALYSLAIYPAVDASGCTNTQSDCMEGCYFGGGTVSCGLGCVARVCLPVGQGFYSPVDDNTRYPCPPGEYSDIAEAQVCTQCPEDTYQDALGQISCTSCSPGTFTNGLIGQDSAFDCILVPATPQPSQQPSEQPSQHPSLRPSALPSYEPSDIPSLQPSMTELTAMPSDFPSLAPSASIPPTADTSTSTNSDTNSSGNAICSAGHTGERCERCCNAANMDADEECTEQYFFKDGSCTKCPSVGSSILVGVATVVFMVCIFIAYRYMHTATPAMFYIGVDYLQVLSFLGSTALSWPRALDDALSSFAFINFDLDAFLPLECLFGFSHEVKTITLLVSPLAVSLGIALIAVIASSVCRVHRLSNRMIGIALGVMYFAYLQLCSTAVDALFFSESRTVKIAGAIASVLYVISFPLLVAYMLMKRKQAIKAEQLLRECSGDTTSARAGTRSSESDIVRQRYGFLFGAYRSKRWYWSVVVLGRKLWLVCVSSFWERKNNPVALGCLLALMFVVSGGSNFYLRPYMMLAQEMSYMARQLGMDDDDDDDDDNNNIIDDTKYRSITMRWNVDVVLHASLCIMAIIGAVSTGLDSGVKSWKSEIALSFCGLAILGASLYLLVWAIFSEISRMVRFAPKSRKNNTRPGRSKSIVRRFSASLHSSGSWRISKGSEIVPTTSNDEPQRLHIPTQPPPPPGPPPVA